MSDHRWASAIAGANAHGADLTYDPRFERLLAEIDKLSSVTGGRPDWHLVEDDGEALLTAATKDLRLATWLTLAKTHLRGWEGLADSLTGLEALVEAHWDAMFPPIARLRARANAIELLWSQLPTVIRSLPVNPSDATACDSAEAVLGNVVKAFDAKLGEANPSARDVRNAVSERQRDIPRAPAPAPEPPPPQASAQAATTATPAAPPAAIAISAPQAPPAPEAATIDAALDIARAWCEPLLSLARQARRANPAHPWSYRLARIAAWLTVEELPEIETGAKTYVRAPRAADQQRLTELFSRGEWADLLDASEEALVESPLWLDLNRWSAVALERLGHRDARTSVARETGVLVSRFPRLVELQFSNGSPLASAETASWLAQENATHNGAAASSNEMDLSFLDEARTRMSTGDTAGGVALALRAARERPSEKERFFAEARVADLALSSNEPSLGKAIAEALLERIDPATEAWAPEAVGLCYEVFINAERISARSEERAPDPRVETLLKRMLRFAPESALRLWHNAR